MRIYRTKRINFFQSTGIELLKGHLNSVQQHDNREQFDKQLGYR